MADAQEIPSQASGRSYCFVPCLATLSYPCPSPFLSAMLLVVIPRFLPTAPLVDIRQRRYPWCTMRHLVATRLCRELSLQGIVCAKLDRNHVLQACPTANVQTTGGTVKSDVLKVGMCIKIRLTVLGLCCSEREWHRASIPTATPQHIIDLSAKSS